MYIDKVVDLVHSLFILNSYYKFVEQQQVKRPQITVISVHSTGRDV
jgi:hypothetical protein